MLKSIFTTTNFQIPIVPLIILYILNCYCVKLVEYFLDKLIQKSDVEMFMTVKSHGRLDCRRLNYNGRLDCRRLNYNYSTLMCYSKQNC